MRRPTIAVATICVLIGSLTTGSAAYASLDRFAVAAVSNPHADLVSGGDVLVRVTGSTTTPTVTVDGHTAVTAHPAIDGGWLAI